MDKDASKSIIKAIQFRDPRARYTKSKIMPVMKSPCALNILKKAE
jgi:hypothetical protein